jgi:hypothetical protein
MFIPTLVSQSRNTHNQKTQKIFQPQKRKPKKKKKDYKTFLGIIKGSLSEAIIKKLSEKTIFLNAIYFRIVLVASSKAKKNII